MTSPVDNNAEVPPPVTNEEIPPPATVEEDPNKVKLNLLNQAAREILERMDPEDILSCVDCDFSGKGKKGSSPLDVFGKAIGGGGGGGSGSVGL